MLPFENITNMRPMFLTPLSGPSVTTNYVTSMIALINECWRCNIRALHQFGKAGSLVTRTRAEALAIFLKAKEWTHLFFIDGDVGFQPAAVLRMLLADKDVIAGAYPKKDIFWPDGGIPACATRKEFNDTVNRFPVNASDRNKPWKLKIDENGIVEVSEAPTGFMCIKREVFTALMKEYPDLSYKPDGPSRNPLDGYLWRFFDTMIEPETQRFLSEDYAFCRRWRDIGGEVYVDMTARLSHMGSQLYQGDMQATMKIDSNAAIGGVGFI